LSAINVIIFASQSKVSDLLTKRNVYGHFSTFTGGFSTAENISHHTEKQTGEGLLK
jgi:hypothetical protein